ncbi:Calx-beta domain-containing protein [Hymenobacter pini]|uniref:Calx-beta domain-containing protein n=1 Tax=Hymenobacter pini TaxID=2880879 RepID=UPI001CF5F889|nr:Calx-beta domain-containing protein [Hymenobacter pini]MCA8829091.1 T9SS type A sorting domain-containing protein [Hymenobacter pini]
MKQTYSWPSVRLVVLSAALLGLTQAAQAQTLGQYSFNNAVGSEVTFPADAQPTNATLGVMSRGAGITPSDAAGTFSATGWSTGALDATDYFSFSVTPSAGYTLRLDSLRLDERRSGTGIRDWAIRSSLDNFTADIKAVNVPDNTDTRNNTLVTLPAAFAALNSSVEFRIYGYNSEAATGTWRIDDVRVLGAAVAGTTTVPTVSFGAASATVAESAGVIQIPVSLSAASTQAVTVQVALAASAGTATSPADYTFTTQTLTFPAGSTAAQNATLTIVDDAVFEQSETIILSLQNVLPAGAATIGTGTYTITITDNDTAPAPTITPIASLKPVNADGTPTQTGTFTVVGVIYGPNYRTVGYQGTIMDRTGGLGLFSSSNLSITPVQGDSVQVTGTLGTFRGLSQLTVTSITKLGTSKLMRPRVVTGALTEAEESQLIVLPNVTATTPSEWTTTATAAYTVKVQTAAGVSYDVRINPASTLFNQPAPTGSFSITGIGSQFATTSSAPYSGGYQLVPRYKEDIGSVLTGTRKALTAGNVRVFPNPAADNLVIQVAGRATKAAVTVTDLAGRTVLQGSSALDGSFSLNALRAGTYVLLVQDGNTLTSHKIVKQ